MKKTIIISAIALSLGVTSVNAKTVSKDLNVVNYEYFFKVNSFCVSIAHGDLETVQKLIARGADVNERSNGMTPAMYAAKFNRTEILELLITHGADLKAKCSSKKMTALHYAKLHGAKDTADIIKAELSKKKKK
ncbi:ankyrin repeat domain-containing protein [Neotamlana laminarinivorans]|uniref:Ankyrin repeat domain-containing protein n=1 Tax=Neotamlana laminarinivorans TaxID=2883124 RepID=A0A9X1L2C0_9FLAO|nr:ankyrin repeat domain-containing protein [Tamlana laminarinivorans]MCB4799633.1 ankyrin repeat domain-containing protein [Tamlana laminarinivorans]